MIAAKTCDTLLESLPFWEHLSPGERQTVLERRVVVSYRAGQNIRGGNMDCLGLLLVARGVLRAYLLSPEGREITLYRTKAGETCLMAASCVLHAVSFETQVEAEADSEVVLVPIDVYSALVRGNIHVECASYKMATERFSDVVAGVERLVFLNLEQRLAAFLLDEATDAGTDTVQMTHEQIALDIGSAREAVSRTLKTLATQGMVELFRGGVRLLDKPALYRLVE